MRCRTRLPPSPTSAECQRSLPKTHCDGVCSETPEFLRRKLTKEGTRVFRGNAVRKGCSFCDFGKADPFRTMGRKIGYARVSTNPQSTDSQVDDLKADGCEEVFFEKVSSTTTLDKRHQLRACLSVLSNGDLLCVAKLDHFGRSQVEVINRLNDLQQQGIHIRTLDGWIDTKALGKMAPLVVGLLTGVSEVERSLIQERSRESVEHRRKTGRDLGGRPQEGVAGAAFERGGRVIQIHQGADRTCTRNHHQNRQRAGSDGMTKVLLPCGSLSLHPLCPAPENGKSLSTQAVRPGRKKSSRAIASSLKGQR